jgi:plastocyanin
MRRRGGLLGGAAVAVAALLGAVPALVGGGIAAAESGECEWRPHKVRVVKQVKRHGKRVAVVRKRVRWSCVPVPAAPVAAAPVGAAPAAVEPAPPVVGEAPLADPHRLGAIAHEFYYVPTHSTLSAGEETIELANQGQDTHNLNLAPVGGGEPLLELPETQPGSQASGTVTLPPGQYRLWCSLPEHDENGMHTTITVVP